MFCSCITDLRLKAFPHEGHLCVPLWMWRWCCSDPGCLKNLPHSSQLYLKCEGGKVDEDKLGECSDIFALLWPAWLRRNLLLNMKFTRPSLKNLECKD